MRRLAAAVLALAAVACTAGYPPPPGGTRAIAHEAPHVALLGDSVTNQAFWVAGPGAGAPADLETFAGLGWHAGTPALRQAVAHEVAQDDLDILVIAIGLNDSADGWTGDDVVAWTALLDPVPPDVCIRVLLPHYQAPGLTRERSAYLAATRSGITAMMAGRRVSYADYQHTVDRYPWVIAPDGIHLPEDPETGRPDVAAARRRLAAYWPGVERCGPIPRSAR